MTYTKKEREYYNKYRASVCDKLGITECDYNYFRLNGQALHNLYELDCNGEIEQDMYDGETKKLYDILEKRADKHDLYIYFQTDPRGATVYLSLDPIPENNYTIASCIY